jgi:hypothetical protein
VAIFQLMQWYQYESSSDVIFVNKLLDFVSFSYSSGGMYCIV